MPLNTGHVRISNLKQLQACDSVYSLKQWVLNIWKVRAIKGQKHDQKKGHDSPVEKPWSKRQKSIQFFFSNQPDNRLAAKIFVPRFWHFGTSSTSRRRNRPESDQSFRWKWKRSITVPTSQVVQNALGLNNRNVKLCGDRL